MALPATWRVGPRRRQEKQGGKPFEVAPLTTDEGQIGSLVLLGGPVEPLDPASLSLLGASAALIIEQATLVEQLRSEMARTERTSDQVMRTERLRVVGEMALGIAHEFNNVLNAMLGQIGVLEIVSDGNLACRGPIARLKKVAMEGARTVSRLQDFSRQRRDREFSTVDLTALVEALVSDLRRRTPDLVIDDEIAPGVTVLGDEAELRDALAAIGDNAVEAQGTCVTVRLARGGLHAVLLIGDDGCGMSRDARRRAFDPFFTTKGGAASGLGLSVAYGILRRHGGRIDLESAPNEGTRVRLRLPAVDHVAPFRSTAAATTATVASLRILLVEDDDDNREAMEVLLGAGGHTTVTASSGTEGIKRFDPTAFDLVLTDLGLPDMTGWDVAREVRRRSSTVPVALITGWGMNQSSDEIHRHGVDALIKKPIEPNRFLEQLGGIGAQRRTGRA